MLSIKQQEDQARRDEQARIENSKKWHQEFQNTVNKSTWSPEKKKAILDEYYTTVTLDNNNEIPLFAYKNDMVMNNPVLFQHYLDFLNNIDENTGTFKNTNFVDNRQVDTVAKAKIAQLAQQIQSSQKRSTSTTEQNRSNNPNSNGKSSWVLS